MRKNRLLILAFSLVLVMLLFTGCGKENKYVNVGVEMSTSGLSLYLTNEAKKLGSVSTYVLFSNDLDEKIGRLAQEKQGIDICYLPVNELSRIKADSPFSVVFIDTFEETGELKGVWIARNSWFTSAPNTSAKYLRGMVKSTDYRASHMTMSYEDALASISGMRDFDFDVQNETLQFVAVYDQSNKDDKVDNIKFAVKSATDLETMFSGFASGTGEGYELCKAAYDKYCTSSDSMSFEKMFNLEKMVKAIDEVLHPVEK